MEMVMMTTMAIGISLYQGWGWWWCWRRQRRWWHCQTWWLNWWRCTDKNRQSNKIPMTALSNTAFIPVIRINCLLFETFISLLNAFFRNNERKTETKQTKKNKEEKVTLTETCVEDIISRIPGWGFLERNTKVARLGHVPTAHRSSLILVPQKLSFKPEERLKTALLGL